MKNSKIIKIVIPVVMVLVVAGIWVMQSGVLSGGEDLVPRALNITSTQEIKEVSGLPTIIDFGADECIPCVEMAPVLLTLNEEMQGKAYIKFVDVWKYPEAATGYPVMTIPTQIFINADGTPYVPSGDVGVQLIMYQDPDTEEHLFTVHQGGLTEEQMRVILSDMGVR